MAVQEIEMLGQSSGYGILVGVGALFAIGMILTTKLLLKYLHEDSTSTEVFMVANRSVSTPLVASSVYLSWTWATELLWATTMVYNYGIMASYWYSAGLSIQICLMTVLGVQAKKKIPSSHTSLEIVSIRYGKACHLLYMFLSLTTNLISCSTMILGAAGAITAISGNLHIVASTMLIPFGVLLYTTVGGLKATFLTDFVHSLILLIVLCYIDTSVLTSKEIGGLDGLFDLILKHDKDRYVEGNYEGSFLTGKSQGAIFFGIILTIGNFGLTVMDSSFWQKSFSADVRATLPGYLTAAILIFANSWGIGSIVGISSIVLESSPVFPTYPKAMTADEIGSGLVLPYTIKALLGKGGLGALLLIIYLAVTSTVSAQMISVSSIMSFDIYKKYINKDADNHQMIKVSHIGVVFFGLFSAGFSIMLHYVGVNMTWLGYFLSMIICPGVIPLVLTITWDRQTRIAAFVSPIVGLASGLAIWLGTAYHYYGVVTITSLGEQLPCMFGAIAALFLPGILSVFLSLTIKRSVFDWNDLRKPDLIIHDEETEGKESADSFEDKSIDAIKNGVEKGYTSDVISTGLEEVLETPENKKRLLSVYLKIAYGAFFFVLLITWVLWPLPLYRDYIWGRTYFKGYIVVSLIWVYAALLVIGVYPLIHGRSSQLKILKGVYHDYIKRKK
ncbi:uncharacterized protein PRCAT00005773001 [Priceomyces carsonii]|uniref:uncharacterized protein n=1 Tax=Priceomyces carsonii TaxID=28549 RepID=UPI002ED77A2C|nr:unnamed protein product [Priceomyces carsonii]